MNPKPKTQTESRSELQIEDYETILRSLQAGVCRIDADGIIGYANETAESMFGLQAEELAGMTYFELFFGAGVKKEDPRCGPIEFALAEGEMSHINTELLTRKDGSTFLSELICVPVLTEYGIEGAVVSFVDVTGRRQVEDVVSEARDRAIEAARSKAEFLANMSHEIRTPLTAIIATAELLSATDTDENQKEYLTILRSSTELLHGIVNEILDFSKLEAGKFVIRHEVFSLKDFTSLVVDPFRALAIEKTVDLMVDDHDEFPDLIESDPRSIQQILNNLLSNALKFTSNGSIRVSAGMNAEGKRLRFAVKDTGTGIPDSQKERLFAPFEQADTSNSRSFEGTGLGLAISKSLVKLLGGEIGAQSEYGTGSEFWFEIPVEVVSQSHATKKQRHSVVETSLNPRILVVEDNPVNLKVTIRLLAQLGIEAEQATGGAEAVEACLKGEFDIILMDCQMPGMDGYEAARKISEGGKGSAIIAFTASVNEDNDTRFSAAGMSGVLRKPFTINDLATLIETHFEAPTHHKNLDLNSDFIEYSISKLIEPDTLQQMTLLGPDEPGGFLSEILGIYADHFSKKLPALEESVASLERKTIKSIAHNLKGSSANLGFSVIYGQLRNLEELSGQSDREELINILHEIKAEFDKIRDAVVEFSYEEHLK